MRQVTFNRNMLKNKVLTALLGLLVLLSTAQAQSGGDYILEWSTIDGGGGTSSGAEYVLSGTAGQPDAGEMTGGQYELSGGFWPGGPLCLVEFEDYARFARHWLASGSGLPGDLDGDLDVDEFDLKRFVDEWLYECP
ncbi:MAG: hypothetical protein ACYS21_12760, partial [Planctomycetota bacterium]